MQVICKYCSKEVDDSQTTVFYDSIPEQEEFICDNCLEKYAKSCNSR